jgi:UDP-N-acetylglucosamine acyltransferase
MATIDATARVAPGAEIGRDVSIGPYSIVGPNVEIGDGCRLVAHVHVTGHTRIGRGTVIYPFASLGTPPQSVKYRGGPTRLLVGSGCDIREGVTINIGTEDDRGVTEVGDRCFLMAGSHVAHDCKVGNDVTFANNVVLGGHVTIGDFVVFGGQAAVRQFVRIGEGAMVVGLSGVRADVIPFGLVQGPLADLVGLNIVGMRRRGIPKADIHRLRQSYEALFFGAGTFRARLDRLSAQANDPLFAEVIAFIRAGKRPLTMATRRAPADDEADSEDRTDSPLGSEPAPATPSWSKPTP